MKNNNAIKIEQLNNQIKMLENEKEHLSKIHDMRQEEVSKRIELAEQEIAKLSED
jgi:hypothetical protein